MRSEAEIKDILYTLLKRSELSGKISGKIYKIPRPVNSQGEDVTINILDGNNGQFQEAVVNVNLYLPDIQFEVNSFAADEKRIRELSDLFIKVLDGYTDGEFKLRIEKQPVFKVEGENQHCINNRVLFTIKNI